jgi:hypothetical protein
MDVHTRSHTDLVFPIIVREGDTKTGAHKDRTWSFYPFVVSPHGLLGKEARMLRKKLLSDCWLPDKCEKPYSEVCGDVNARIMSIAIIRADAYPPLHPWISHAEEEQNEQTRPPASVGGRKAGLGHPTLAFH